jgi:hypothetical protein
VRALAEYVMRTRYHALIVSAMCIVSVVLYWLGAAIIALTTFKQGVKEGANVWLWSLLPAGLIAVEGNDPTALLAITATFFAAVAIKNSVSWAHALVGSVALISLVVAGSAAADLAWLNSLLAHLNSVVAEVNAGFVEGGSDMVLPEYSRAFVAVTLAGSASLATAICLFLGRSMHASLDKPGAFGEEFRAFQFPAPLASVVIVFSLALFVLGGEHSFWMYIAGMPLFFSGISCVHAIAHRQQRRGLLVSLYLFVVLVNPVAFILIMALGFIDSLMDLRKLRSSSNTH